MRSIAMCAIAALGLQAQSLTPREKAEDYPAHAALKDGFTLAADYLVHTLPVKNGAALLAGDYLVIEIAAYGPKISKIDLSLGNFTLRVNGKTELTPESAGTVAASIKFPDWRTKPHVELEGGTGNSTVGYGQPRVARFPGDPTAPPPRQNPLPEQNPAGLEKDPPVSIEQRVQASALGTGEMSPPFAGLVFFPFQGKTKKIKTLEVVYESPQGRAVLKLEQR